MAMNPMTGSLTKEPNRLVQAPIFDSIFDSRKSPSNPRQHWETPLPNRLHFRLPPVVRGQWHDATGQEPEQDAKTMWRTMVRACDRPGCFTA